MIVKDLPFGKTIGGHAIASICGYNDYEDGSATDVWEILTGKRESRFKPSLESEKGHALQPLILKYWAEENSLDYVENVNWMDKEYNFMTGHIDACVFSLNQDGLCGGPNDGVAEVKTVNFQKARMLGNPGTGEVPKNWAIQCMWYLMLTDKEKAHLLVYANDRTSEYIIHRDKEIEKALRERAIDFWNNHVLADIPPLPTTPKEIGRYYSRANGKAIEATHEILHFHAELKEVKENIKQLEKREEFIKSQLQVYMQENEALQINGALLATWKNSNSSSFDVKTFKESHPELYNQFLRTQEIRRFLIK